MDAATGLNLIQNTGFPIAACVYLVFRMEKLLKNQGDVLGLIAAKLGVTK